MQVERAPLRLSDHSGKDTYGGFDLYIETKITLMVLVADEVGTRRYVPRSQE